MIGAGPAGLTAACELVDRGVRPVVLEADKVVGGISRTVEIDGWRFDIGGHRFFTKVEEVEHFWHRILPGDDFLRRPRLSRIYYNGKFFHYPLRPWNALSGLGPIEAIRCVASYGWARLRPPANQGSFEGWTASRFGRRLYMIFFKTYTEKVWGVPATEISADWAAQRIKNLSLFKAVWSAMLPRRGQTNVTSLIEEFWYPRLGPGMMWERARLVAESGGAQVIMDSPVTAVHWEQGGAFVVTAERDGDATSYQASHVISSMPLGALVESLDPAPPGDVLEAARDLSYRDFLTVALVIPIEHDFPDNWIYVHDPDVRVGRIQNFGRWSPDMVKDGLACLGLEYFVFEGDDLWDADDEDLVQMATREIGILGLVPEDNVIMGFVARMPKAYPTYDEGYLDRVELIKEWLFAHVPNLIPVGRNGMHRYNNQDHSMYTAMLAADNVLGASHDVWSVNVDPEYHEERSSETIAALPGRVGTGRDAPVLPRHHEHEAAPIEVSERAQDSPL